MTHPNVLFRGFAIVVVPTLAGFALGACSPRVLISFDKNPPPRNGGQGGGSPSACIARPDWLPSTPPLTATEPPHHPAPNCPFYQGGVQSFLRATQPDATGAPAFASYSTLDDVLVRTPALPASVLAPPGAPRGTSARAWLGYVKQAGQRAIAIDRFAHAVYYGIHLDQAFVDFMVANHLQTAFDIQSASPALALPAGVVSLKSAWMDIDPSDGVSGDFSSYITTMAWVSRLRQDPVSHAITEDPSQPRLIRVALLALHVAFTIPGHPEMIWTTFEHADVAGNPDVAPILGVSPPTTDVILDDFPLYNGGTLAKNANTPVLETDLRLNEAAQSFSQTTSIYRMFPASKSNTTIVDPEVASLNASVAALFVEKGALLAPADRRARYRLIGGIWLDRTELFGPDASFQNDDTSPLLSSLAGRPDGGSGGRSGSSGSGGNGSASLPDDLLENGSASRYSIVAGEDRMSGVAIESFTQLPGPFDNCMACHNTRAINTQGVPFQADMLHVQVLKPGLLNVSHVFSQAVIEECLPAGICSPP